MIDDFLCEIPLLFTSDFCCANAGNMEFLQAKADEPALAVLDFDSIYAYGGKVAKENWHQLSCITRKYC